MKCRLATLLIVLSLFISQITWGADTNGKESAADRVMALPFNKAAPLPGALAVSADGRLVAHISANGDVVIWNPSQIKPLEVIPSADKKPSAVSLSPDGNIIAIGYFDSRVVVRSLKEKKPLREFFGHSGGISALSFSSDGQLLASGGDDATTQLWEVATGKRLRVFDSMSNGDISTGSGIPVSIGFSGDGQTLIVNEWYSRFYDVGRGTTIWDIKEGIEISTRTVAPPNGDNAMRAGHALGGKGWLLAYTGDWVSDNTGLMVERLDQCDSPHQLPSGGYADTVAADPLGRWVAATEDEKITFFGMNSDKKGYALALPAKAIALVPHPDGRTVFALMIADTRRNGNEHFIFGRDAEAVTGGALYRIPVPASFWQSPPLSVKEDATHCAPTGASRLQQDFKVPEKPVELAVIAKLVPTKEMTTDSSNPNGEYNQINPPSELYFAQEGSLYALYHAQSDLRSGVAVWDMQAKSPVHFKFKQYVGDTTFRLKEGWGALSETLQNLLTGKPFYKLRDTERQDNSTAISDMDTGEVFRVAEGHFERYASNGRRLKDVKTNGTAIAFSARNGRLAALYLNGNVQVWRLGPRGESKTYKLGLKLGDGDWAEELALSADGRYLRVAFPNASGDGPTQYVTYRLSSAKPVGDGQLLAPFPGRANRGVVADTRPHRLAVWDFDKAEIIARLPRHRSRDKSGASQPLRATLSDDGRLIASASYDGLIRVWDIDAHQMIGEGRTGGEVTAIAFDLTGQRLAAGRKDGEVVVFQVSAPE
ncbi:MAG TPA: hypothetical protein PLE48_06025 [Thiobacillus sp.]|nr:MAG: hypothetical protein B7Y50_04495 [Hydrogenophilales bacterium 28-61-11]OYZ58365.1 MAG: hypothetical protein B7Y21_03595 [Hydrogenophilales bacterium 16-61-112]OZA47396.1 MAG: hypothetical protein B7X81_05390 [Hydrogenophilales bacterium 17-61-76]HQT30586.1 hypothetical protein [Thiobacillus sp.]HQT69960.1 hypothetical protein [Thiobacillus sp.]